VIAERICAQGERIEARYRAALAAEKVAAEPVAWMIRIGDSNVWSYTQLESDADFYGKQSGMKYEKRPLYAAPQQPAQSAEQDERAASPTSGMTLGERIAHVGGRTNAAGYIEFGSVQAVNALVEHVLRDARAASTQSTATQPAQTQVALTNEQIWQSLKGIADSHTHPDDVVEAGRALLAAQPADGGKS
jgi:hypothetical protein